MADSVATPPPRLLHEADGFFNSLYEQGSVITTTPAANRRRERFYNLMQLFSQTLRLKGLMAECGCWNGLSSFMLCHYALRYDPAFKGEGYHIFDSFEGLSVPTEEDSLPELMESNLRDKFGSVAGAYAASLENVRAALAEFPRTTFHKGWIPAAFEGLTEGRYKFVHIDVDLYKPTRAAVEYFYPRLMPGGLIVCDDYGSLAWPGAKRAIDEYRVAHQLDVMTLSTSQAVLYKNPLGELKRAKTRLREQTAALDLSAAVLTQTKEDLRRTEAQRQQTQTQLQATAEELNVSKYELEQSQAEIHFMKSTKFWKLREQLLRCGRLFRK